MKIAIIGSRDFKDKDFVFKKLEYFTWSFSDTKGFNRNTLISGGARGVDSWAEEKWVQEHKENVLMKIIKPDWKKYGKRAGFLRNKLIIDEADVVIAFWDGKSKGTKHSIDLAIKKGIPTDIYIRK